MRILDAVILTPAAERGDGRDHDSFRRRVARQPIGHDGARHHPESLQELAKEALRGECVPAALHEDVEDLARVIDGPPQPAPLPVVIRQSSSRCQTFEHVPRARLNRRAYSMPNRSVQRRMTS